MRRLATSLLACNALGRLLKFWQNKTALPLAKF
jgi:hypothetical protein